MNALKQYLISHQLIQKVVLDQAEENVKNFSLINYLARNKLVSAEKLALAASEVYRQPIKDLNSIPLTPQSLSLVSTKIILDLFIFPLQHNHYSLDLAMSDPGDTKTIQTVQFITGLQVNIVLVEFTQLQEWIHAHVIEKTPPPEKLTENPHTSNDHSPAIHFVNDLIKQALQTQASDLHIELFDAHCRIRFRHNGLLNEMLKMTKEQAVPIMTRLKLMANLNIAEKRLPQDGHCKIRINETQSLDVRVNSCPTIHGEKLALRLLNTERIVRTIDTIDLLDSQKKIVLQAVSQPHGLILVTGPTGSGKTVTLYAMLSHLNTIEKNISTVEDPVEIQLAGINQVNINQKSGLTFSTVLRAMLRQDPDIIMIGEIRDLETAEIAIRAAQTGRLVLSTLHTNSAIGALTRLQNMGIEPYHLASAITLITAQRLLRKLCPFCKQASTLPKRWAHMIKLDADIPIFKAAGCRECQNGYQGRLAIHEVIPLGEKLVNRFLNHNPSTANIQPRPLQTLQHVASEQIKNGTTSLEEVLRVISFFEENDDEAIGSMKN